MSLVLIEKITTINGQLLAAFIYHGKKNGQIGVEEY